MDDGNAMLEQKKALARRLLIEKMKRKLSEERSDKYRSYTYDMYMYSMSPELSEIDGFNAWMESAIADGIYPFESARLGTQKTTVKLRRDAGEVLDVLNFASYNYLGLGYHPEVILAAQEAVARYGLGAASAPVLSGTYEIHRQFENELIRFFGLADRGVSLFTSGFGANLGTIQAFVQPGHHVILDQSSHMSLLEGARVSGATIHYFRHNDMAHLQELLVEVEPRKNRTLVCMEGVYSGDGDFGRVAEAVALTKRAGAYLLVDEAHSTFLAGTNGRGVAEMQGVLGEIDLYILTMSKGLSGVGGALIARKAICRYVNWYAKCRLFSAALDPAVTGGMLRGLELLQGPEGIARRKRLIENADYLRSRLRHRVEIGPSESWIIPVIFGSDRNTLVIYDHLQRSGLDVSIMQFPAVPKNEARLRLFVTSEHTREQLDQAARLVIEAAEYYNFARR
jgi:7-keto-8-aminopelargonate synthetase-like enzyme